MNLEYKYSEYRRQTLILEFPKYGLSLFFCMIYGIIFIRITKRGVFMCGFVGFYSQDIQNKNEIIKNMSNKIVHRGPDSEKYFIDDCVALAFRRLSIIDLEDGSQPMFNEDNSKVIIFNGEIYNFRELKEDLLGKGHIFKTLTDTEVILHGYEEYGKDILHKLRGMFAFVIWDLKEKILFGARDHFGIKPFYYSQIGNGLIFGSEIKSFLPYPNFEKKVNEQALKPYLVFQYSALDETFFKNVFKLRPGSYFTFKDGKMNIQKYFEISYDEKDGTLEEYVRKIQTAVQSSVEYHQFADVEVGAFLSGGVDSSYVVSTALPDKTYSVGFENDGFDETIFAKELSERLNINNESKIISKDEFFDAIPKVQYHSDEPHANLSSVPLYYLSELASKDVKVVLSGEGADELFAGYNEYEVSSLAKAYSMLPMGFRKWLYEKNKDKAHFRGKTIIKKYGQSVEERYIGQANIMSDDEANSILNPQYKSDLLSMDLTARFYKNVQDKDDITKRCYLDMNMWIVDDILLKADKMTMAHSLELRVPLLDKEMWNLARAVPSKHKVKGTTTKYAFRLAAEKKVPIDWAKRRKAGFLVPFIHWIREEKYYNRIKEMFNRDFVSQFFDKNAINTLLEKHYSKQSNEGRKIYTIYAFLVWYDEYFVKMK